jgi:hypothetical protein
LGITHFFLNERGLHVVELIESPRVDPHSAHKPTSRISPIACSTIPPIQPGGKPLGLVFRTAVAPRNVPERLIAPA